MPNSADTPGTAGSGRTGYRRWVIASVILASLIRFRWVFQPLAPDEGGYLAIARAWGDGGALYTRFWVDRPQGLMYLYRLGNAFTPLGDGWLRLLAVICGISGIIAVAWMGAALSRSWRGGAVAAVFVAVLSSSPALEGFTANGELMSAAFVVPGVAILAAVVTSRLDVRWMFLAGVLAGLGLSVKQSGYDGLIGSCLWFAAAWLLRWRDRRELVRMFLWLIAGLTAFLVVLGLHGTTFGWSAYWNANVGFRLRSRSAVSTPQWGRLGITSSIMLGLTIGMIVLAVVTTRTREGLRRLVSDPLVAVAVCWLAGAGVAVFTGGNYHRHYWITVAFPLALVLALAVVGTPAAAVPTSEADPASGHPADEDPAMGDRVSPSRPIAPGHLAFACAVPLAVTLLFAIFPSLEQDSRLHQNTEISEWIDAQPGGGDDVLLPVCGSANYHVVADQTPPYPYLWVDNVVAAEDSVDLMVDLIEDPDGPEYVARFQPTEDCDESGRIESALAQHFETATTIDEVEVLRRR